MNNNSNTLYRITDDSVLVFDFNTGEKYSATQAANPNVWGRIVEIVTHGFHNNTPLEDVKASVEEVIPAPTSSASHSRREILSRHDIVLRRDNSLVVAGYELPPDFGDTFSELTETQLPAFTAMVKRLYSNKRKYSADALINWIMDNPSLEITDDGCIIGFRSVHQDYLSQHAGYGIVNGVEVEHGHLDNSPGNVIEYPEFMIDHSNKECSLGLHVGTADYANRFVPYGRKLRVVFAPEDVVSFPASMDSYKVRVTRYTVIDDVTDGFVENYVLSGVGH